MLSCRCRCRRPEHEKRPTTVKAVLLLAAVAGRIDPGAAIALVAAMAHFKRAAEAGSAEAWVWLALTEGARRATRVTGEREMLERAAAEGSAEGRFWCAHALCGGRLPPERGARLSSAAHDLLQAAAKAGYPPAMYVLGCALAAPSVAESRVDVGEAAGGEAHTQAHTVPECGRGDEGHETALVLNSPLPPCRVRAGGWRNAKVPGRVIWYLM